MQSSLTNIENKGQQRPLIDCNKWQAYSFKVMSKKQFLRWIESIFDDESNK